MPTDGSPDRGAHSTRSGLVPSSGPTNRAAPAHIPDRQHEATIEGLTLIVDRLRRGAAALKTENRQLRADVDRLQSEGGRDGDTAIGKTGKMADVDLPLNSRSPGAARLVVAHCLTGLISHGVLRDAQLLVSELVTNSVRHGELGDGETVLVRVSIATDTVRLEVENPGTAGVVAPRRPDAHTPIANIVARRRTSRQWPG